MVPFTTVKGTPVTEPSPEFSVLFSTWPRPLTAAPDYFRDLNLDAVARRLVRPGDPGPQAGYFATLTDAETVALRQAVFRDLDDDPSLTTAIDRFCGTMDAVRALAVLAARAESRWERVGRNLQLCEVYLTAVDDLAGALRDADLRSPVLCALGGYLTDLTGGPGVRRLRSRLDEASRVRGRLRYGIFLKRDTVTVRRTAGDAGYLDDVRNVLRCFIDEQVVHDAPPPVASLRPLNHVQREILDRVAPLFHDEMALLADVAGEADGLVDDTVIRVDQEFRFYLRYRELLAELSAAGFPCCLPSPAEPGETVGVTAGYDVALALARTDDADPAAAAAPADAVVTNDVALTPPERVLVVSGPNQGGKTTFARMVGQLHHLAAIGVPVPGTCARLELPDAIYTHFEREEIPAGGPGKLGDELLRVQAILKRVTAASVVILNETFGSTSLADARGLGRVVLAELTAVGALTVYVTFVDELSRLSPATVSLVSSVDPADPVRRTFRIERRSADGRAYAQVLAEHYGLSADGVRAQVRSC